MIKVKKDDIIKLYKKYGSVKDVLQELNINYIELYSIVSKDSLDKIKTRFPYSKNHLITLHDKYGSITKVAAYLNRSYSTVRYWYKELGIVFNESGATIFQKLRKTALTELQMCALIGSVLGDGGLWLAPHSKNARLYVSHCAKQLHYLKWLHMVFKPFARPIKQTEKKGKKYIGDDLVKHGDFYRFYTIAHPDITYVYKNFYKDNYKRVSDLLFKYKSWLTVAVWFADDGSIERNNKGVPVSCSIATCSFTYEDHLKLVDFLRYFFKGTIQIKKRKIKYKNKVSYNYIIKMYCKKEVNIFLNNIKKILPKEIHYKLS